MPSSIAPGIQAWYNQFLDVDPDDPDHVFVGLEEVFETEDGGTHWDAIGPYWNFDFPCWSSVETMRPRLRYLRTRIRSGAAIPLARRSGEPPAAEIAVKTAR